MGLLKEHCYSHLPEEEAVALFDARDRAIHAYYDMQCIKDHIMWMKNRDNPAFRWAIRDSDACRKKRGLRLNKLRKMNIEDLPPDDVCALCGTYTGRYVTWCGKVCDKDRQEKLNAST